VPGTLAQFSNVSWLRDVANEFQPGSWIYYLANVILIVFFTYFYTAIIFNPVDLAENLKKQGGFVPGVKPGTRTAEYIDQVLSRITLPGSLFLVAIAMLPYMLLDKANVPFSFGGTSLLIVVGVALDTVQQMQQHMILRQYDGFMKQGRIRFRGRQRFM
jgi:preprotein translocase subunit SecY